MKKSLLVDELAINLSSLSTVLSFLCGYFIGSEDWRSGLLVGGIYLCLDNITSRLWLRAIKGRKQYD